MSLYPTRAPLAGDRERAYEITRIAAAMRLAYADSPLDGIYYWVPVPEGWRLLSWFLESIPGESEESRYLRFNQLKHPHVFSEVLAFVRATWEISTDALALHFSAFPRGRISGNNWGKGSLENRLIPYAPGKVLTAFNRKEENIRVITDEHWDPTPKAYEKLMSLLNQIGHTNRGDVQRKTFSSYGVGLTSRQMEKLEELQGMPGEHFIPGEKVYVSQDLVVYIDKLLKVEDLQYSKNDSRPTLKGLPVVYFKDGFFSVIGGEERVEEVKSRGGSKVLVWLAVGEYSL